MASPLKTLKNRITDKSGCGLPKGELWLGRGLFDALSLDDSLENHLQLADRLGHALVCLPVANDPAAKPDLGYRYFCSRDVRDAARLWDGPVFAVIDGPFQEMVNQMGLMGVLTSWINNREEIAAVYRTASEKVLALVERVLECSVDAVVFADDVASDTGPLVSPSDIDALCSPFYARAVATAKKSRTPVFLHTCGNLSKLLPVIRCWQIDGFAAVQSRLNDLVQLYRQFDSEIMIMAGIELELLESGTVGADARKAFEQTIASLEDALVFCSSCGLYKGRFIESIKQMYAVADTCVKKTLPE